MSPLALLGFAAWGVPVKVCVDLDVEYGDAISGDRWTQNTVDQAARGFRYQVIDATTNAVAAQGFLDAEGADRGCAWVDLVPGDYRARLRPKIVVDDVEIAFCDQTALTLGAQPFPVLPLGPGQQNPNPTQRFTVPLQGTAEYEQLVAMAYALTWFSEGLQYETLTLCHDAVGANRWEGNTETLWLKPQLDSKDLMTHELGHAVAYYLSGGVPGAGGASQDNCQGSGGGDRGVLSKEYTSFVIKEGIATFFAITTWNSVAYGCHWLPNKPLNWDLTDDPDWSPPDGPIDCDEGDDPDNDPPEYTDGIDWLSDLVTAPDAAGCVGPTLNRSVAWDWVTYWWALYTDEGMPLADVYAVLGEAVHQPTTWDTNGSTPAWTDDPLFRWVAAMDAAGWLAAHQEHADHVDH